MTGYSIPLHANVCFVLPFPHKIWVRGTEISFPFSSSPKNQIVPNHRVPHPLYLRLSHFTYEHYNLEESTLNRKRPESQRWQFYHPQFQRDFPHLRANIKRKSARSMNTAPATSRVVFEHGKGYFLQRNDRSRSNSGEGPQHPPPPAAAGLGHMQVHIGPHDLFLFHFTFCNTAGR